MKGDLQTWEDHNHVLLGRMDAAIDTCKRGDDAYKRWPVDLLELARATIKAMGD